MRATSTERLLAERRSAQEQLASLNADFDAVVDASREVNNDDEHDPEGATIAFERAQIMSLVIRAQQHLQDIDAALERVDIGAYGSCEECGGPVGEARLEAQPAARRCVRCASGAGQRRLGRG